MIFFGYRIFIFLIKSKGVKCADIGFWEKKFRNLIYFLLSFLKKKKFREKLREHGENMSRWYVGYTIFKKQLFYELFSIFL